MEQQKESQSHLTDNGEQAKSVQRMTVAVRSGSVATLLVAALAAFMGRPSTPATPRKSRKPVPRMVCSPAEEIAAHNDAVEARKSERAGHREDLPKQSRRVIVRAVGARQHKKDVRANRIAAKAAA